MFPEDIVLQTKYSQLGATREDLYPASRKGCLDIDLLKKCGLTKQRMQKGDALFFYQLILPMCDPSKSGIEDDPCMSFYVPASTLTNKYATVDKQLDGNYGHRWDATNASELVNFDGIVFKNKNDNIHDSWCNNDEDDYDRCIANAMYHYRFLELRSNFKLNDNAEEIPRGQEGHDPCAKYRLVWDVMVNNVNAFVKEASLDQTIDETTWSNMSFGGLALTRIRGKPGVTKGGQNVVLLDSKRRYIHAWHPRHRLNKRAPPFTQEGPAEIKAIVDMIDPLIQGHYQEPTDKRGKLFRQEPHLTFDNHFSGNPS